MSKFYIWINQTVKELVPEGISFVPLESGSLNFALILYTQLALRDIVRSSCLDWISCFFVLDYREFITGGSTSFRVLGRRKAVTPLRPWKFLPMDKVNRSQTQLSFFFGSKEAPEGAAFHQSYMPSVY